MDEALIRAVEELDENQVHELVKMRLREGIDPFYIQEQVRIGMEKVGILYEQGEYFIADLIMAGILFVEVLEIDGMLPCLSLPDNQVAGTLVIGTAPGDLHDIGKNIFSSLMKGSGFVVHDLGTDVSTENFCNAVIKFQPDIVFIYGVLTLAIDSMKKVITALEAAGLRNKVKVILGGHCISHGVGKHLGADAYTRDVSEGVKRCLSWMSKKGFQTQG
ncbi:Methionine synthase [Sporomusa silvacetica DSM 10669]|uniref:Methionine synthase n=1 Tax=Sporomusa silvacetica DSM 10669 TaxID=1123289 RepID=A0ABZ3IQP2_9FIRM|nr:cobalamin-dependent protein [Sporomusa silvacetica]OZC16302.1 methionine synthase [Sporomusa silvacetica DSM 10669]